MKPWITEVPTIDGGRDIGGRLHCSGGRWFPKPTGLSFQWLRNGVDIAGQTSEYYVSAVEDAGQQLSCRVRNGLASMVAPAVTIPTAAIRQELIRNGSFRVDTTGWRATAGAVISAQGERLRVSNGSSKYGYALGHIKDLKIGQRYTFTVKGTAGRPIVSLGTPESTGQYQEDIDIVGGAFSRTFEAVSSDLLVSLKVASDVVGDAAEFASASLKEVHLAQLRYSPPKQENPTIVDVGMGFWTNKDAPFAEDEDFIIELPERARTNVAGIQIFGGRHGRIIGGDMGPGRILAYGISGSLFVEGIRWQMTTQTDCIGFMAMEGSNPDWFFQNLNAESINGVTEGVHADMIQAHGRVGGTINVHNITCETDYQGFFIPEDQTAQFVTAASVSNANFRRITVPRKRHWPVYLFFQVRRKTRPYPVELISVWCEPIKYQRFSDTVQPNTGIIKEDIMYWPSEENISGVVYKGSPAEDFCPREYVGAGYVSPGYVL